MSAATAPDAGSQAALAERLRDLLADRPCREVAMFGSRVFLVDDRIVVGAQKTGDLLVRVPPERADELRARPGTARAVMGRGRRMGAGWLTVSADAVADDARLAEWVEAGVAGALAGR